MGNKIPGPPPLPALLDYGIQQEIDEDEKKRLDGKPGRFPLSPSQFGACGRKLAIDLSEYCGIKIYPNEPFDPRTKRRFTRGYDIEYSLLRQMRRYVPISQVCKQQLMPMAITPDGKHIIGGSIDVLFDDEQAMITDIKSKGTFWSNIYTDKFKEDMEEIAAHPLAEMFGENAIFITDIWEFYHQYPKDNFISRYFKQLNSYGCSPFAKEFVSNHHPGRKGIQVVSLLFENKNNHMMSEVRWVPDDRLYDEAIDNMQDIYKHVVIDKKPAEEYPADFSFGSLNCKLCSRNKVCYGDAKHPWNGPKRKWPRDINRIKGGKAIDGIYLRLKQELTHSLEADKLEAELITALQNAKERKVKFSDGHHYTTSSC